MGVYIKGMKMPENCDVCPFDNGVNCMVYPPSEDMVYDIADGKPEWCPLIELPPHGRLIDADALKDSLIVNYPSVIYAINNAPAIIEAEEVNG